MLRQIFSSDTDQGRLAQNLYDDISKLPLICPHGHVDPRCFADPSYRFGTPVDLLILPDHYIFRMLYSQGIALETLGIPRRDGAPVEGDHRKIWQIFCDNWALFRGTPSGMWLREELASVFGITQKPGTQNAQAIYDEIVAQLDTPDFQARRLFEKFNIEVLATTDAATDELESHQAIRASGWQGRIIPTFRPDALVQIDQPGWQAQISQLSAVSGIDIRHYAHYIEALAQRRTFFREMGATATDHGSESAYTEQMGIAEATALFEQALLGRISTADARRFEGHMLIVMADMSCEDGLVMQLHSGSLRNHNVQIFDRFGANMGADIPIRNEFTRNLKPLLDAYGNHESLRLILFTLDESCYSRELAPLAGHYPILRIGPPWWFFDSLDGMKRYFEQIMETAGLYNTVGFNDDTRAFPSIPARHELWRRASADWLAGLLLQGRIDDEDAQAMAHDMAYGLARRSYRL